jgi:ubiquinone/menaquinone biosynthesis C-methylase UbiE
MSAAYDSFDYPSYWVGREYEHDAEVFALKNFLNKISNIKKIADIGCGYGRLTPYYIHRTKRAVLVDPSASLLKVARESANGYGKKIKFIHSRMETYNKKVKAKSFDLILFVRVMHHINDFEGAIKSFNRMLKDDGYLILEFPNKRHLKALFTKFFKGDLTYYCDIFPTDIRCRENKKKKTLPFYNYHPEDVINVLKQNKFEAIEIRSVSNIRNEKLKLNLPLTLLDSIEYKLQPLLARFYFGPSIFILAQKKS